MTNSESVFRKRSRVFEITAFGEKATFSPNRIPHVAPVGFDFDGSPFYIDGINIAKSTKYRSIVKNNNVALVIDDLKTINPWDPQGIKIYGTGERVARPELSGGQLQDNNHLRPTDIRIKSLRKWSWGIDEAVFREGKFIVSRASSA